MKNLSTKISYTGLITPLTKFQPPALKDERKHLFLVISYSIMKYESHSLEPLISELVSNRAFRKYKILPPPFSCFSATAY